MDLGFLTMPKPFQRPHPPFVDTAVASFSQGVTEAARRYATDPDSPYRFCYNQLLSFRGETGDFGTLLMDGKDWADPDLSRRSMTLLAKQVKPAVNTAEQQGEGTQ